MFGYVALIAVVVVALVLAVWLIWAAWRNRQTDFIFSVPLGSQAQAAQAAFLDRVIPVLVQDGFRTVAAGGHTTVFERRFQPAWTVLLAIFLFPFGLLALFSRGRESVTVIATSDALEVQGFCARPLAELILAVAPDKAERAPMFR